MEKPSTNRRMYNYLLAAALITLSVGTVFYHFVEKLSWLNSYYFSSITLTTVGYGDITPHTAAGKLFTTFYIFMGVGILTTFLSYALRHRAEKVITKHKERDKAQKGK